MRLLSLLVALLFSTTCFALPVPEPIPPKTSPWSISISFDGFVIKHNDLVCMRRVPIGITDLQSGFTKLKNVPNYDEHKVTKLCVHDPDVQLAIERVAVVLYYTTPKTSLELKLEFESSRDAFARAVLLEVYRLREGSCYSCEK